MTDSEKLDFLIDEMKEMRTDMTTIKADMVNMKADMADMKTDMANMKADMAELKLRVTRLESSQSAMKLELLRIDRKISDTYNLALDAWGSSVENRAWLEENDKLKA